MSEIIYRIISNGREFEIHTDPFSSLHALRSECNSYTASEARYTELLEEHDKQIREDEREKVIDKLLSKCNSFPNNNDCLECSFAKWKDNEWNGCIIEQLKEISEWADELQNFQSSSSEQ